MTEDKVAGDAQAVFHATLKHSRARARLVDGQRVGHELDERGAVRGDQHLVRPQLQRQARVGEDVRKRADQLRRQQLLLAARHTSMPWQTASSTNNCPA